MQAAILQAQDDGEGRNAPKRGFVFVRTVPSVMQAYGCNAEAAQRYIDLRNEGYGVYVASVMAGIAEAKA